MFQEVKIFKVILRKAKPACSKTSLNLWKVNPYPAYKLAFGLSLYALL